MVNRTHTGAIVPPGRNCGVKTWWQRGPDRRFMRIRRRQSVCSHLRGLRRKEVRFDELGLLFSMFRSAIVTLFLEKKRAAGRGHELRRAMAMS
jgi:hypothetical protein